MPSAKSASGSPYTALDRSGAGPSHGRRFAVNSMPGAVSFPQPSSNVIFTFRPSPSLRQRKNWKRLLEASIRSIFCWITYVRMPLSDEAVQL